MLVRTDDGPIDVVLLPIDVATHICLALHLGQDALPKPTSLPPVEAGGDGLPRPIACRQIAPRRPRLGDPEHAVEDASVVVVRVPTSSRVARWQEWGEPLPLLIR